MVELELHFRADPGSSPKNRNVAIYEYPFKTGETSKTRSTMIEVDNIVQRWREVVGFLCRGYRSWLSPQPPPAFHDSFPQEISGRARNRRRFPNGPLSNWHLLVGHGRCNPKAKRLDQCTHPSIQPPTHPHVNPSTRQSIHQTTHQPTNPPTSTHIHPPSDPHTYSPTHPLTSTSTSNHQPSHPPTHRLTHPPNHPPASTQQPSPQHTHPPTHSL